MGASATQPRKRYGGVTNLDNDGLAMLVSHAYLAQQDGGVIVLLQTGPTGGNASCYGYVDTDSDPPTGGTKIAQYHDSIYTQDNDEFDLNFDVAKDEYFEIRVINCDIVTILWRSKDGTILKPIDYN